jgi:lipopolysaccharide heptosyltransferase I
MTMPTPQRILIVRPSALGDVCRSVPVLASVRAALPDAHIAWLVQDDFAPAIEAHPAVNEVIAFPRNRLAGWWRSPSRAAELWRWLGELRRQRFEVVLDCQGLSRSGLITLISGADMRVGLRDAREFAWLCYNRRVPDRGTPLPRHTVDQMLCVLEPLGVPALRDMRLYVSQSSVQWWSDEIERLRMKEPNAPYAVLAPGSRWPSKRWPIERFADLVEPLLKRGFARVVIIGSAGEREQVLPLLRRFGLPQGGGDAYGPRDHHAVVDLVGRTSIGQTMAIVAGAGMVIANDSAPLHMAVGFDRPCVALFGPTDPEEVGPYGFAECVVRGYEPSRDGAGGGDVRFKDASLGDSLMRLISTAMVLQRVDRVLALWPTRRHGAAQAAVEVAPRMRMAEQPVAAAARQDGHSRARSTGLEPETAP